MCKQVFDDMPTTLCACLFKKTDKVTEKRSMMMTSMKEPFAMKKPNNIDLLVHIYVQIFCVRYTDKTQARLKC